MDNESIVSTTTQLSLKPAKSTNPVKRNVKPKPNTPRIRPSAREFALVKEHLETMQKLVETLQEQNNFLRAENSKLKEDLEEGSTCNILLFSLSDGELSVASVTDNTPEGVELFARVSDKFQKNEQLLRRKGIAFGAITDVPLNQIHDTPFHK